MKIAFGNDHAALKIRFDILKLLSSLGYEMVDFGYSGDTSCDYPDIAQKVAEAVSKGECDRGILVCGTGVGMSMAANKVKGIRAGVCWNNDVASLISEHNNANIMCLPARFAEVQDMVTWVKTWIETPFSLNERHIRRVNKINEIDSIK